MALNNFAKWAQSRHACVPGVNTANSYSTPQAFWDDTRNVWYMRWLLRNLRSLHLINRVKAEKLFAQPLPDRDLDREAAARMRQAYPTLPTFKYGTFLSAPAHAAKMAGRKRAARGRKRAARTR